jgi:hypothetical protein
MAELQVISSLLLVMDFEMPVSCERYPSGCHGAQFIPSLFHPSSLQ